MNADLIRGLAYSGGSIVVMASLALAGNQYAPLRSTSILRASLIFSALAPLIWLLLFIAFVGRASLELGYLPSYDNPDPKELGYQVHRYLVWLAAAPVALSPHVWVSAAYLSRRWHPEQLPVSCTGAGLITSLVLLSTTSWLQPSQQLLEWFAD
jgi:hypothetical protein